MNEENETECGCKITRKNCRIMTDEHGVKWIVPDHDDIIKWTDLKDTCISETSEKP